MFFADGYSAELLNNLSALIDSGRVPHAIIIEGAGEQRREQLAKRLAGALLCTGDGAKPCGVCPACKKTESGSHPDIISIEAEDKKKTVSIDVIRKMRDDAYVLPNEADKKIYIIQKAHTMQPYAQNALLKILEEPPRYASFILLCEYHTQLLPTVISRCVVFNIESSKGSEGGSKARQNHEEIAQKIAEAVAHKNEFELLVVTAEFEKNTELLQECLTELELILRDAIIILAGGGNYISGSYKTAQLLANSIEHAQLLKLIDLNRAIIAQSQQHANNNLTITRLCSTLIQAVQNR